MPDAAKPAEPKPSILLQLDSDPQPSVFDAAVAVDSGVDHLFRHGGVAPRAVRDLVYGLLFTRGGDDLRRSAVFIGGSDVAAGEAVLAAVLATFFGPFRVSVALDPNGANTTAAAAVRAVERSLGARIEPGPRPASATVVGAGPVGRRVARLLAARGATVRLGAPDLDQATGAAADLNAKGGGRVEPFRVDPEGRWAVEGGRATVLIAAGPPGVEVLPTAGRDRFPNLAVAVDLNAVPPHGLGGLKPGDADKERDGVRAWGPLGIGSLKMKIHKAVIRSLYEGEPTVFDLEQVFDVARRVDEPAT